MTETKTDDMLLAEFVRGERLSLAALADRYERSMLGLAMGLLGGRRDLAMDAAQETWVRVIRFAGGFRGQSSVKTWIYTILVHQCRSIRSAEKTLAERAPRAAEEGRGAEPVGGDERLRRAVEALGDGPREVVLMCYHLGMTHEAVAEVLGAPLGTVKSRLHAGLKELRAALSPEDAR